MLGKELYLDRGFTVREIQVESDTKLCMLFARLWAVDVQDSPPSGEED